VWGSGCTSHQGTTLEPAYPLPALLLHDHQEAVLQRCFRFPNPQGLTLLRHLLLLLLAHLAPLLLLAHLAPLLLLLLAHPALLLQLQRRIPAALAKQLESGRLLLLLLPLLLLELLQHAGWVGALL
jgi:hypothetical protein